MDQKQQIADRLKEANNILVTVSNNPSVDQLASCIGLTLALNKLGKHATAVFSGNVPSTIEFLQPEKTIEKNTDSLRDFIIALDKAKADKLRYKVEDKVVKIFITPYRTSISDKDLNFSQGDFNVDVVLALGVHQQQDLDQAITMHGRILHDAVVATVNTKSGGELGSINWTDPNASSLSELVTELLDIVDKELMDGQMATALLTGIVAETDRFSNDRTSPSTMSIAAELMASGANQQLVATKLEQPPTPPPAAPKPPATENKPPQDDQSKPAEDGTLEITHPGERGNNEPTVPPQPAPESPQEPPTPQIHIDDDGRIRNMEEQKPFLPPVLPEPQHGSIDPVEHMGSAHTMILQPPTLAGGEFVSPTDPEEAPSGSPTPMPQPDPFMGAPAAAMPSAPVGPAAIPGFAPTLTAPPTPMAPVVIAPTPPPAASTPPSAPAPAPTVLPPAPMPTPPPPAPSAPLETLSDIEKDVNSPHLQTANDTMAPAWTPPPAFAPPEPPPAPAPPAAPSADSPDVISARDAVMQAIASQPPAPEAIEALNAQPLGAPLHAADLPPAPGPAVISPTVPTNPTPGTPPPLPPPMMPPSYS